jgi:acetyltransferase-like isoleucine patch superfamily enzyme
VALRTSRLYVFALLKQVLPETSGFALKRALLRWAGASIGDGVRICSSCTIMGAGTLTIGTDTWVGHEVMLIAAGPLSIGPRVDIAPRAFIGTGTHRLDPVGPRSAGEGQNLAITIGPGAWIGACSVILPGTTVHERAVVAAGAVVTADVAPRQVVAGVPARVIRALDAIGGKPTV